ncbi:Cytidine deaminase [Trichostrongylus colubriformis]|uniref:Cytidine deaminase n=1 Tax=Trichostrongylus colubriformis TaxID=6319 RepID=A0AAN8ITJ4_TRICO
MAVSDDQLIEKAKDVMKHAYCPYSKFPVGAAILTPDNTVIVGANCENASYGGTICAERNAITTALSKGYRKFKTIAVVTELEEPGTPCGMCRQFLIEFGDCRILMGSSKNGNINEADLVDLLPKAFTPAALETHDEENKEDEQEASE